MPSRRGHGEGSLTFDAEKGRWVGRLPRDERGRRAKVTGRTRKEVQQKLRRRLDEREQGLHAPDQRVTVQAFLDAWVRDTLPLSDRARRTIESYEATVRLHLIPGLGRLQLAKLTPFHVQQFLSEELTAGKGRRTVQLSHTVLRIALGQAEAWGMVPRNVAKLVQGPSGKPAEREPFTDQERRAILVSAQFERLYPLFVTAAATGLRLSELLGVRWRDVDLDRGELRVRHQLDPKTRTLQPLKSEAGRRTVPLPPSACAVLREHRDEQRRASASAPSPEQGLVFTTSLLTPLGHRNVTRVWDRVVARAGVKHRGIHHLRHAYGTSLAERGVHERAAQYLLGHADSRTTREVYTHTTDRMLELASDAVAEALSETLPEAIGSPIGSPVPDERPSEAKEEDRKGR